MAVTTDIRGVGEKLKSQFDQTIDQATSAASSAADAVRSQTNRLAGTAQEFYDELEGDNAGAKLRAVIADYPLCSLAVAAAAGFLLAQMLRR
jgi:ElaB/YqjD/DUF883 family membrane-anchored ribosome-binding protein